MPDPQRVAPRRARAGADLERDGNVDRGDHCLENARDQRLVAEQRGAGEDVADLFCRAAHVDVDDLRAAVHVIARGVGHQRRIGTGNLNRDGRCLAFVVEPQPRLAGAAQLGPRSNHLGHREAGAEASRELPEGAVGDARHRSDKQRIAQHMRSDLHALYAVKVFEGSEDSNIAPAHGSADGP